MMTSEENQQNSYVTFRLLDSRYEDSLYENQTKTCTEFSMFFTHITLRKNHDILWECEHLRILSNQFIEVLICGIVFSQHAYDVTTRCILLRET